MKKTCTQYISSFKRFNILVIGDLILDVYLKGACSRIAPEGAFPVIDLHERKPCLGGAGNTAANLKALGCKVILCTVTGHDQAAAEVSALLQSAGISTEALIKDEQRATLVKTRISAPSQTLIRFDQGTTDNLEPTAELALINALRIAYAACDGLLIADYQKGIMTPGVIKELERLKKDNPKFIGVDAKDFLRYAEAGPSLIKPNYEEALKIVSLSAISGDRATTLQKLGAKFYQATAANITALTLDSDGALFFEKGEFIYRSYAPKVNSPEVSGAGDTFISTCMLALIAGACIADAAEMATVAAVLAVNKTDTAICEREELLTTMTGGDKYIRSLSQLKMYSRVYHSQGKRIVFTNGCFDILHSGHVSYLNRAKAQGDIVIVGLNNDESVRRLKGRTRPVNKLAGRVAVLSALSCVDHVVAFGKAGDDTPISLISAIRPSVFVKGGDYQHKILPEGPVLQSLGCEVIFLPYIPDQSTTGIITKIEERSKWKMTVVN